MIDCVNIDNHLHLILAFQLFKILSPSFRDPYFWTYLSFRIFGYLPFNCVHHIGSYFLCHFRAIYFPGCSGDSVLFCSTPAISGIFLSTATVISDCFPTVIFFPKMIIWVFMLKTRDERGGGLPKGGGVWWLAVFVSGDRVSQGRGHPSRVRGTGRRLGSPGRVLGAHCRVLGAHGRVLGAHGRVRGAHGRGYWSSWSRLGAPRRVLGDPGRVLGAHGCVLGAHCRVLAAHGRVLGAFRRRLGTLPKDGG